MELAERRARLEEEAARKIAEKEMKPKKPRPAPRTDWVVSCIKGMKIAQEKTWYQVKLISLSNQRSYNGCGLRGVKNFDI